MAKQTKEPQGLHDVDKRLAVLEALSAQAARANQERHNEMMTELTEVRRAVDKLKLRVAGFSAVFSVISALALELIHRFAR